MTTSHALSGTPTKPHPHLELGPYAELTSLLHTDQFAILKFFNVHIRLCNETIPINVIQFAMTSQPILTSPLHIA
jgi:hypothetical protein